MVFYKDTRDLRPQNGTCVTIGNFDGVHLGHQSLITLARNLGAASGLEFVLITFWPHPRLVLPARSARAGHSPLSEHAARLRLLADYGAENILELTFTRDMAELQAAEFVEKYLLPLNMRHLVVGHDFSLGRGREGNVDFLRGLAQKYGFALDQAQPFMINDQPVSSTRLRQCLREGQVAEAATLLGRPYSVCGKVIHGAGRGSGLGFPTANLGAYQVMLPANGVYATFALCDGKRYQAVTNIGTNPTFKGNDISVESFLLDCDKNLYGQELCLEFIGRIRSEGVFASAEELGAQINRDVETAKTMFSEYCA